MSERLGQLSARTAAITLLEDAYAKIDRLNAKLAEREQEIAGLAHHLWRMIEYTESMQSKSKTKWKNWPEDVQAAKAALKASETE